MTKDQIEDYLYFFWAPLLKVNAPADADKDSLQQMIILTLSQATIYIEAPGYVAGTSSREYADEIVKKINEFADKIVANIPGRATDDSFWLKITTQIYFVTAPVAETQLEAEASFGPYKIEESKFTGFDFYYLPHQIQIQLPTTAEISAVISAKKPFAILDGNVTNIVINDCTLWLSSIHFDAEAVNASFYTGLRLKECHISFDGGYAKSGSKIAAGLLGFLAGFVITCVPEDGIHAGPATTIASGNTLIYPNKLVFSFKHRPGLPQPPKISLTHTEPFTATLFGSVVTSDAADNVIGGWLTDKNLLSFPLTTQDDAFSATENSSPIFDLKGNGKINNVAWYLPPVSTSHPLGFSRLGIAADSGSIGFDSEDQFTLTWNGLENGPLKLKDFFIRTSRRALFFSYTFNASLLASQHLHLWNPDNHQKSSSVIDIAYNVSGKGNFVSRNTIEQNAFNTGINVNIDRPLLSNGDRIFSKTTGELIFIRQEDQISAVVIGREMDPSIAFENNAFKQFSSFALSNALILVNPVEIFFLAANLDTTGIAIEGQCFIRFSVRSVEHTLPDPYITSLFNEQPDNNVNIQPTSRLLSTIQWNEADGAKMLMQFTDDSGNAFSPKSTMTDDQLADALLRIALPHPGEEKYDDLFRSALAFAGIAAGVSPDALPYASYKSFYHSKVNAAGAFSALHILPGNITLVDVSGRASQMGVAFSRRLDNAENGVQAVFQNTGYNINQPYRIENNELVSSGRFVRAFTLPQVQWEPVYFEEQNDNVNLFSKEFPFPTHGVPTRISSANRADVTLTPAAVTKYIVESFKDETKRYAAAAHFALPFGMNSVALFHPFVNDVKLPVLKELKLFQRQVPDPYSYSILNFNQPDFNLKKGTLSGAIQIKVTSEGLPGIPRDEIRFPDPSFHGAILQMPNSFSNIKIQNNVITYDQDSILGKTITGQFNAVMWGKYIFQQVGNIQSINFSRSANAKVPLRRIDFSGFGASIFSNWLNNYATAGSVSQVQFNILIGRVAHEVVQIKSVIIPWFIPVVRTLIIERKNHGNIIRTDTGWVPTGPGEFHFGYTCHPGVVKGVYNVANIKDTAISLVQKSNITKDKNGNPVIVEMAGVYFDADVKIENVISGAKNTSEAADLYRLVPSKKQFGYILLGNPDDGVRLENFFTDSDLQTFMSRPDVGALGGPVDCIVNIAGANQMMHLTRIDVTTAITAKASVASARGTLLLPKGGSWSVVKKVTAGATLPMTNDETVPLIRNGVLQFDKAQNPTTPAFANSFHVLGNPLEIEKYAAGQKALANTEYALLQSTGTQKLLFPRPSFNAANTEVVDGVTRVKPQILVTNPVIADPYSLIKSNAIFPDNADVLTLKNGLTGVLADRLDIIKETAGISFPDDITNALKDFIPPECIPVGDESRKLYMVKEDIFKIFIDYGIQLLPDGTKSAKQLFTAALNGNDDNNRWQMRNKEVAIVVELGDFKPLLTVKGDFTAEPGAKPQFDNAHIEWGPDPNLKKIIEVLSILSMLSKENGSADIIKDGFSFAMGNSPDNWSYKCTIEEKIPVIKFPNAAQLAQLPGPAPLIVEAGLDLGVFFNLSLSADPGNLVKAGAGIVLGFEATIQVLLITIEVATAYGVGTAKVEVFIELPDAKPTFKFTMGFGATVAVQLPMVGYVSLTRVISLGASFDNGASMTVGQMLRGVLTIGGGLASVTLQVEASGTVTDKSAGGGSSKWTAVVRGVFTLDVTVAFVLSWDFSEDFEHEIDLPNPF
jgi:hypothetical protein